MDVIRKVTCVVLDGRGSTPRRVDTSRQATERSQFPCQYTLVSLSLRRSGCEANRSEAGWHFAPDVHPRNI
jgi:hypothetical protein